MTVLVISVIAAAFDFRNSSIAFGKPRIGPHNGYPGGAAVDGIVSKPVCFTPVPGRASLSSS
jgi:hypothetical protein